MRGKNIILALQIRSPRFRELICLTKITELVKQPSLDLNPDFKYYIVHMCIGKPAFHEESLGLSKGKPEGLNGEMLSKHLTGRERGTRTPASSSPSGKSFLIYTQQLPPFPVPLFILQTSIHKMVSRLVCPVMQMSGLSSLLSFSWLRNKLVFGFICKML